MTAHDIATAYYNAFNRRDWTAMLDLLADNVRHDSNQGDSRYGKESFAAFLQHMDDC